MRQLGDMTQSGPLNIISPQDETPQLLVRSAKGDSHSSVSEAFWSRNNVRRCGKSWSNATSAIARFCIR